MQTQPAAAERSPQKCAIWDGRQVRHSRWRQQIYHRCRAKSIKEKLGTSCIHNLSGRNEFTASWSLGLDSVWTVVQNKTVYNDQGAKGTWCHVSLTQKPEQQIFGAASYSQGICLSWCLIMHCTCIDVHQWKFLCLNATLCSRPIRPLIVLLKTSCSGALQQTTGLLQIHQGFHAPEVCKWPYQQHVIWWRLAARSLIHTWWLQWLWPRQMNEFQCENADRKCIFVLQKFQEWAKLESFKGNIWG